MQWIIQPARPGQASALHDVATATFPMAGPPDLPASACEHFMATYLSVQAFTGYLANPVAQLWVASVQGSDQLVGYTLTFLRETVDPAVNALLSRRPSAELSKCYVRQPYHGSGLAKALLRCAIVGATQAGMAALWLGVNQTNARAQRFYAKLGFERIGARQFPVGALVLDDYVMCLALDPSGNSPGTQPDAVRAPVTPT